ISYSSKADIYLVSSFDPQIPNYLSTPQELAAEDVMELKGEVAPPAPAQSSTASIMGSLCKTPAGQEAAKQAAVSQSQGTSSESDRATSQKQSAPLNEVTS